MIYAITKAAMARGLGVVGEGASYHVETRSGLRLATFSPLPGLSWLVRTPGGSPNKVMANTVDLALDMAINSARVGKGGDK